jgi:hypothetical protein
LMRSTGWRGENGALPENRRKSSLLTGQATEWIQQQIFCFIQQRQMAYPADSLGDVLCGFRMFPLQP